MIRLTTTFERTVIATAAVANSSFWISLTALSFAVAP